MSESNTPSLSDLEIVALREILYTVARGETTDDNEDDTPIDAANQSIRHGTRARKTKSTRTRVEAVYHSSIGRRTSANSSVGT